MIAPKVFGIFATVAAAGTVGRVVVPVPGAPSNPTLFDLLGVQVPIVPVLIGILTAGLVRVIVITSSPHKLMLYNLSVTGLAMLGAAAFITDHEISAGNSFWVGAGFGAVGVGVVEIAKARLTSIAKAALGQNVADEELTK